MKTSKAILGILAGIAAGAAIGLLFAPDKDSRNKKKLRKTGGDLAEALSERIDQKFEILVEGLNEKFKQASQSKNELSDRDTKSD
jgi:gas vesicle protein